MWKKIVVNASKNGEFNSKYYWVDKDTNLMWQLEEIDEQYTWDYIDKATKKLNNENFGGFDDWRVPTIDELKTIISKNKVKYSTYWSSSTVSNNTRSAWIVNFNIGEVTYSDKKGSHYVYCVRKVGE